MQYIHMWICSNVHMENEVISKNEILCELFRFNRYIRYLVIGSKVPHKNNENQIK